MYWGNTFLPSDSCPVSSQVSGFGLPSIPRGVALRPSMVEKLNNSLLNNGMDIEVVQETATWRQSPPVAMHNPPWKGQVLGNWSATKIHCACDLTGDAGNNLQVLNVNNWLCLAPVHFGCQCYFRSYSV